MTHPVEPTMERALVNLSISYLTQEVVIKAAYRTVPDPCNLLPDGKPFTLKQLQEVHEAVLGEKVQRDSFRRGMLRTGLLEPTGVKTKGVVGKPARFFRKVGG